MKALGWIVVIAIILFGGLQLVRPGIPQRPATAELNAPPEVKNILKEDCYSCHSDERRLAWFDEIVPAYWLARSDILTAREHLNFSTIGSKPAAAQRAALFEGVSMVQLGAMPLPRFLMLHPDARVSPGDLATLKAYLAPWGTLPSPVAASFGPAHAAVSLTAVQPELNGFPFDADFESWKLISTTDRGDNNTFRFVLGNDIAVKAAQSGNISPWPDGTRFAKIAWEQVLGSDGLIHPGKFVQVELMLKDAAQYKSTDGWGWGRWRGLDLKPYGKDAHFVDECTTCHMPVRGNDYVYTLPITRAQVAGEEAVNNRAASLPAALPWQPPGWSPITMYVDPRSHTTATLFGNGAAARAARDGGVQQGAAGGMRTYPAGAALALVTWRQREDPHWFGARIPDEPISVEFVQAGATNSYRRFAGAGLGEVHPAAAEAAQRASFILGLAPAQLP